MVAPTNVLKGTRPRVLLVDDEFHIRVYIKYILKGLGDVEILEAKDGEEAMRIYRKSRADLVLLDVNLPRMDGLEVLAALREVDPECVVIMLTSLANRRTVDAALAGGAKDFIRKDTPKEEIAKVFETRLHAWLGGAAPLTARAA